MNIAINKDIENYKETVVLGLTARQLVFSVISVVVGGGIVLLTYKYIGLTASAYIAIPAVAPIALNGFYNFQGMNFTEMMKRKMRLIFMNPPLTYVSEESEQTIKKMQLEDEIKRKNEEKKLKKNKRKRGGK